MELARSNGSFVAGPWGLRIGVIITVTVFAAAEGLTFPLLSLILERQGYGSGAIGVNAAMTPLGFVLAAITTPWLVRRFGQAQLAIVGTAMAALTFAIIGTVQDYYAWLPLRFGLGVAIQFVFIIGETWINQLATDETRGRLMGLFAAMLAIGFATGPFLLALTGSEGWAPFLAGIGFLALATACLVKLRLRLPSVAEQATSSIFSFLPRGPLLLAAALLFTFFDQIMFALLPVYGLASGLPEAHAAAAIGMISIGNVAMQVPIGWISDKLGRRSVSFACALLCVAACVALPLVIGGSALLWPLLLIWGAAAYGIYTMAMAELGDRFDGSMLLAGNAAFGLMWGIGGLIGPPAAGGAMDLLGPHGLPLVVGLPFALFAAILGRNMARRRAP